MMAETLINTGRSSFFDNYYSDGDTNSDTINDFSQYSDGDLKINNDENVEVTPEPPKKPSVSINVDNKTTNLTNGIHLSDNDSLDIDDDDEYNSQFEITKKTTIRKIISKTTSINGVEKENEVKEFLIKDSSVNDSLKKEDGINFPSSRRGSNVSTRRKSFVEKGSKGKGDKSFKDIDFGEYFREDGINFPSSRRGSHVSTREDGINFPSSRRGSHVSTRRKSLVEKGSKGKGDKAFKDIDFGEYFKSDLEKINDEPEEKNQIMHCNKVLSWNSSLDVNSDERNRCSNSKSTDEVYKIPIIYDTKRAPVLQKIDVKYSDNIEDIFERSSQPNQFQNPKLNPSKPFADINFEKDVDLKDNYDEVDNYKHKSSYDDSLFSNPKSGDRKKDDVVKDQFNDDDVDEKCNFTIRYDENRSGFRSPSNSIPIINNKFSSDVNDGKVSDCILDFRESKPSFDDTKISNMKWIDPTKSKHLKYDSNKDSFSRRTSSVGRRPSVDVMPSKTHNPVARTSEDKINGIISKPKPYPVNDIREYIIRGNIRENLYQIRRPYIEPLNSPVNAKGSLRHSNSRTRDLSRIITSDKHTVQSKDPVNRTNPVYRSVSSVTRDSFRPSRQLSGPSLKRFDSLDSITLNSESSTSASNQNGITSQVSKIFDKVDNIGKNLVESNQSVPVHCSDYVYNVCGNICHSYGCYNDICAASIARLNSVARRNLSGCHRLNGFQVATLDSRNMDTLQSKELSTIQSDYRQPTILEKKIRNLEKRLHTLRKDLKDYKTSEQSYSMEPEINAKSECRHIERQLQHLYESINEIRQV